MLKAAADDEDLPPSMELSLLDPGHNTDLEFSRINLRSSRPVVELKKSDIEMHARV